MALTELQTTLLSILAHALAGEKAELDAAAVDWPALYREATAQSVLAQVYHAVEESIPEEHRTSWLAAYAQEVVNSRRIRHEHAQLHRLMTGRQIPYVSFKGCASAAKYPLPLLRAMGDVDLLVHEEDCTRAEDALQSIGFQPPVDRSHVAHLACRKGRSVWELHWQIGGIPASPAGQQTRSYLSDMIETAVPLETDDGVILVPDDFHHGLVLLVHSAEHMINAGIGLRHLCDWAAFAASLSDDEFITRFDPALKECGLWRFAQLMTQLSVRYLGIEAKAWAAEGEDDALLEAMLEDILNAGNFGNKDHQRINQAKLITDHKKESVDSTGFAGQFVATMNEQARRAMPVCREHPILLPVGWLYAGGRHLSRIRRGTRPEINLSETIQGARHRRDIYRSFHLYE